jgi:hypothetical protein
VGREEDYGGRRGSGGGEREGCQEVETGEEKKDWERGRGGK